MNTVPFLAESRKVDTGETQVVVTGEVDLTTAAELDELLSRCRGQIVVDLRSVDFMDSTGIHVLLAQKGRLDAQGGHLRLLVGSEPIRKLLELCELTEVFHVDSRLHPVRPGQESLGRAAAAE
jgi:anti-sigma B factor antagonist